MAATSFLIWQVMEQREQIGVIPRVVAAAAKRVVVPSRVRALVRVLQLRESLRRGRIAGIEVGMRGLGLPLPRRFDLGRAGRRAHSEDGVRRYAPHRVSSIARKDRAAQHAGGRFQN